MRTTWSIISVVVLLVGLSSCVIHERDDWRGRRYYGRGYYYGDRDRYWDRDRDYDRDRDRDCWREGDRWYCRRR